MLILCTLFSSRYNPISVNVPIFLCSGRHILVKQVMEVISMV